MTESAHTGLGLGKKAQKGRDLNSKAEKIEILPEEE